MVPPATVTVLSSINCSASDGFAQWGGGNRTTGRQIDGANARRTQGNTGDCPSSGVCVDASSTAVDDRKTGAVVVYVGCATAARISDQSAVAVELQRIQGLVGRHRAVVGDGYPAVRLRGNQIEADAIDGGSGGDVADQIGTEIFRSGRSWLHLGFTRLVVLVVAMLPPGLLHATVTGSVPAR